jgi:hypothetical protein
MKIERNASEAEMVLEFVRAEAGKLIGVERTYPIATKIGKECPYWTSFEAMPVATIFSETFHLT